MLFCFGNYSGDVMQFGAAARSLEAEGVPTATVLVTDDVASAPAERASERRGIAGDLFLLKVLGAAADRGSDLVELEAIGARANAATTTIGVAFSGCTLPGQDEPLFEVTRGSVAVGLGIHGEPGLQDAPLTDADDLAATMVGRLLAERPPSGTGRVAVIVNGLGSVKSEELFVLYTPIAQRLADAGLTIVGPEVGEFVTSFEMAGVSLTISWLDDELESLWLTPVDAPGYRRGQRHGPEVALQRPAYAEAAATMAEASPESQRAAAAVVDVLAAVAERLDAESAMLGRLDAVAGDGDHGIGMRTGGSAAWLKARDCTCGVRARERCSVGQARRGIATRAAHPEGCGRRCSTRSARRWATRCTRRPIASPPVSRRASPTSARSATPRSATRRSSTRWCRSPRNSAAQPKRDNHCRRHGSGPRTRRWRPLNTPRSSRRAPVVPAPTETPASEPPIPERSPSASSPPSSPTSSRRPSRSAGMSLHIVFDDCDGGPSC